MLKGISGWPARRSAAHLIIKANTERNAKWSLKLAAISDWAFCFSIIDSKASKYDAESTATGSQGRALHLISTCFRVKTVYGRIVLANHKSFRILSALLRCIYIIFFSHNTAFHHNWRIEIDLATLSWLFGHNNIKRARFISISVSYEILSEVRIFIWFFRSLTLDSHQLNYDFCCDPWLRNGSKCRDGLSRFLTLIHRNGLKIVESCLHFFQVRLLHPLESAWCVGGWHTRTPSHCDVSYVICFVSNKKRNSFMNGKKWVWMSISWWHDNVKTTHWDLDGAIAAAGWAMHHDHQSESLHAACTASA